MNDPAVLSSASRMDVEGEPVESGGVGDVEEASVSFEKLPYFPKNAEDMQLLNAALECSAVIHLPCHAYAVVEAMERVDIGPNAISRKRGIFV